MSTRSIIVVTGTGRMGHGETYRLYKHSDGYPSGNLPIIAEALRDAQKAFAEHTDKFGAKDHDGKDLEMSASLVAGKLIGAATCFYGMGAMLDGVEGENGQTENAVWSEALKPEHLGNQWDIEWIYIVDVGARAVSVYAKGDWDTLPMNIDLGRPTDPATSADRMRDEYKDSERAAVQQAMAEVEAVGFKVNPKAKGRRKVAKAKAPKSKSLKGKGKPDLLLIAR